ncbi:MAG: hypothetical protein AABN95_07245 [Acidobacteriota bacterium]
MEPCLSVYPGYVYVLTRKVFDQIPGLVALANKYPAIMSKSYSLIWLGLVLAIQVGVQAQTTVVIRRTPTEIIVAADSLAPAFGRDKSGQRKVWTRFSCKVIRVEKRAAAFSGTLPYKFITLPNVQSLIGSLLGSQKSLESARQAFANSIAEPLRKGYENWRVSDIEGYRRHTLITGTSDTKESFSVFFLGFENGRPTIVYQYWIVSNQEDQPVQFAANGVGTTNERRITTIFAGIHREIDQHVDDAKFWQRRGNVNAARELVQTMSRLHPSKVGGPIDILRITKDGAEWATAEPKCDEKGIRLAEKQTTKPARKTRK